ncbi:phospholipid methyltransferase [Mycobacterium sp. djl-10]|nr:phospholipid methyltransferase [Mycobacterium sp. djl-10]
MTTDAQRLNGFYFFRSWLRDPLRVAAVAPSGTALSELITRDVPVDAGPVLELGPGTGAFTTALLARGVPEAALTLVESGPDFARALRFRFPAARVLCADAADGTDPQAPYTAIVSGLPLLSMRADRVHTILASVFARSTPDAAMYQFTYAPRCPVPSSVLDQAGLSAELVGRTLRNLPPASVYRITRSTT